MTAPSSSSHRSVKKAAGRSAPDPKIPESRGSSTLLVSPGAQRIVQSALHADVSVAELADLAASDPAFAARILSVSNSAAYTRLRNVTNIQQACALLGIRGMRNIALGMLVADLIPAAEGASTLLSACLRRAVLARGLAEQSGLVQKEDGFFTGLLLEIGLLQQACDYFEECLEVCRSPGRHRVARERAEGLEPHNTKGAALARELALPESIERAILEHHEPRKPEDPLCAVCWVAEWCASVFEAGDESQTRVLAESAAAQIGISGEQLQRIFETTAAEVSELALALECPAGPTSHRGILRPAERDLAEMHRQYDQLVQVLVRVMDDRDRLQGELDEAHLALARAGLHFSVRGSE